MIDGYRPVNHSDLEDGMEVILEIKHWDLKGHRIASDFFRTIVGHHMTVSGRAWHLVSSPVIDWPQIPIWQLGWVYAGNDGHKQMWAKDLNG